MLKQCKHANETAGCFPQKHLSVMIKTPITEVYAMETRKVILELRTKRGLSQDELIDVCVRNMVNENFTEEQARSYMKELLPKLDYWKRYEELSDNGQFEAFKKQLIKEINDLHIRCQRSCSRTGSL